MSGEPAMSESPPASPPLNGFFHPETEFPTPESSEIAVAPRSGPSGGAFRDFCGTFPPINIYLILLNYIYIY